MAPPEWVEAWTAALDELELDVAQAEDLLRRHAYAPASALAPFGPWTAPDLPPLPGQLEARAQAVLDRQLAVSAGLTRAMTENRRQSLFTERMDSGAKDARVPVFLDARS